MINLGKLYTLLDCPGVSGDETSVINLWMAMAMAKAGTAINVYRDKFGNAYKSICSPWPPTDSLPYTLGNVPATQTHSAVKILVAAHIDQLGLIVHYINDNGYVYFKAVGGWDQTVFVGQRVTIQQPTKQFLEGVIGRAATHLMTDKEQDEPFQPKDLWIDFGFDSKEEATKYIDVGTYGIISPHRPMTLINNKLTAQGLDNRVGAFITLMIAEELENTQPDICSTQFILGVNVLEEIGGFHGAASLASYTKPDIAIVIDLTLATDHPEISKEKYGDIKMGAGPVISLGANVSRRMHDEFVRLAKLHKIPHQIEACANGTSTDADGICSAHDGIPTMLISIPGRYLHTPVEVVSIDDIENAILLITEFCKTYR